MFFARLYDYTDVMKGLQQHKLMWREPSHWWKVSWIKHKLSIPVRWSTMPWNCPESMKLRISIVSHLVERPSCQLNCKELLLLVP